jgi:tRNA A-37 threonylcarbamoyl transferase component Bud32
MKRYFYPRWRNRMRGAFRGTLLGAHRGVAEARALCLLRSRGVAAVRPVAYGCRRRFGFVTACFLITEEVPNAQNLTTFASHLGRGSSLPGLKRRELVTSLAEQVRDMHAAGLVHGQLFWRNIVVRLGALQTPEFFFLDAAPRRSLARCSFSEAVRRDLACVAVSAAPFTNSAERVRFLRAYQQADRHRQRARALANQVDKYVPGLVRHETQRIRMNELFEVWSASLQREESLSSAPQGAAHVEA